MPAGPSITVPVGAGATAAAGNGEVVMWLGGTPATFESHEVVDVEAVAKIVRGWVDGESRPPGPEWTEN